MALSRRLNIEDRLIIVSLVVTMGGIVLGALLAEPRSFGITALIVIVFYRPRNWGRAVVAGIFAAAGFALSGVFWLSVLG